MGFNLGNGFAIPEDCSNDGRGFKSNGTRESERKSAEEGRFLRKIIVEYNVSLG